MEDNDESLPTVSSLSELQVDMICEEELTEELQGAFKWAQVGFHARQDARDAREALPSSNITSKVESFDESEAFEISSFKKAATGLVGSALRLVGSEGALLAIIDELMPGAFERQQKEDFHSDNYAEHDPFVGRAEETGEVSDLVECRRENYQHNEASAVKAENDKVSGERGWVQGSSSGGGVPDEEEIREFLSKGKLPSFKDIASVSVHENSFLTPNAA